MTLRSAFLIAGATVALQQAALQQPTFRAGVSVVEVSAVVLDDAGRAVSDLAAGDFEIVEDGQVRPLVSLRRVDGGATSGTRHLAELPPGAEVESLATNRGVADAPVFVLLLDDLNISPYETDRAIRAGLGVLGAIPHEALFAVVTSSGTGGTLLTPTPPTARHADQIRQLRGQLLLSGPSQRFGTRQTLASSVSAPCGVGSSTIDSPDCGDPTRAARRIQAVGTAAQILGRAGSKRKVLFWLTTDMGVSPLNLAGTQGAQRAAFRDVLNADVAVYPIDPRENYVSPDHGFDQRSGGSMRAGTADTVLSGQGGAVVPLDTDDMVAVTLEALARQSGGRRVANTNDLGTVLAGVVRQNMAAYILAYESADARDARQHRIAITVRRPHVRVYARRGYVSAADVAGVSQAPNAPNVETLLESTLLGSVPQGRLGLQAQVVPRFAVGRQGSALVNVLVEPPATGSSAVTLAIMTVDSTGQVTTHPTRVTASSEGGSPSEVSAEVPLARGRHQIRIAAATPDGSATGLVLEEVEIQEPGRDLLMGPPVLLDHRGGVHATVARAFVVGHPLGFQVEVGGRPVAQKLVNVRGSLLDAHGKEIRAVPAVLDGSGRSDTARATGVVSTDQLAPGDYLLLVEARRVGSSKVVKHAMVIHLQLAGDLSPKRQ